MNNIFDKACDYATKKHKGQYRKDGSIYILHPFEVAVIASTMTNDEEVLSAAILHDVLEECNVDISEITNLFGKRVSKLVALETEPKYLGISKEKSWPLRKMEAIRRLNTTDDIGFKIIYLSDKLSNIRSLYNDYLHNGIRAFDKFNISDINVQAWYYYSVLNELSELSNYTAYSEYKYLIDIIFKEYGRKKEDGEKNYIIQKNRFI